MNTNKMWNLTENTAWQQVELLTAPVNCECIKDVFVKLIASIAHKGLMQTSEIVEKECREKLKEVAVIHNHWRKEAQG